MSNETSTYLPWELSDEASQVADGGREESGAEHSAVASLYPLLCCPPALALPPCDGRPDPDLCEFLWLCSVYVIVNINT